VHASILGEKYYYLLLERDNLKDLKKKYKDSYIKKYLSEYSYAYKVNAKLDGDLMKSDPIMKQIADYISKIELNINYNANTKDLKDTYLTSLISTKYDGKKFAEIDIKSANNKMQVSFPGLTEKKLGIESSSKSIRFTEAFLGDDKAFEELFGLTRGAYDKILERYLKDVIFKQIPDENVAFNNDSNFEDIKCNSITFNIDQKVISNIYKAVAKELENDKEVRVLVKSIANAYIDILNEQQQMDITVPTEEEIEDEIKNLCDELNESAEDMEEVQLVYTAYFKNNGDIISRQISDKLSDTSANLSTFKDFSGTDIFNLNFKESDKTVFELKNEAKLQDTKYNGVFNLDVTGKSIIKANYSYEKDAKVGNLDAFVGDIQGKISLKQFNDSSLAEYSSFDLDDIYFSIINKKIDNDTLGGKSIFTTKVDDKRIGLTIFTEVKQSNVANITKPVVDIDNSVKLTDDSELNEMGTEIVDSLQKKLLEIVGLPISLGDGDIQ